MLVIPAPPATGALPDRALSDIAGTPMVVRVWRTAVEARIGRVVVATGDEEVARAVRSFGGQAVIVSAPPPDPHDLTSLALQRIDPKRTVGTVIELRGDLPTMTTRMAERALEPLSDPAVDMATLAAPIRNDDDKANPAIVKAVLRLTAGSTIARAVDFTRLLPPEFSGTQFEHIEIFAFRRTVIENFVRLPVSAREQQNRIVPLRALDAGMRIDVALVDTAPKRVDTPADLERVRAMHLTSQAQAPG